MPKIKDIPKVDRPREKLEKYGPEKLSSSELLAIILGKGTRGMNVVEMSKKILRQFPGSSLADANFKELKKTFGLGATKACEIVACFELSRRFLKDKKSELILSPRDVWENLKDIRDNKKEHFVVFYLDARNQKIQRDIISIGILNANLIHPREVFEPAIYHTAAQILIAHNHPSGDTKPSDDDLAVTKRLIEAGKILGIEVSDHVIVSQTSFLSLKCEGLL
jgi:DNA repair protein RadC